jgi:hypothetical protein
VNVQGHILLRRTRPNRTGMACGRTVWPSEEGGVRACHEGKHVRCLLATIALFLLFVLFFLGHVTGYGECRLCHCIPRPESHWGPKICMLLQRVIDGAGPTQPPTYCSWNSASRPPYHPLAPPSRSPSPNLRTLYIARPSASAQRLSAVPAPSCIQQLPSAHILLHLGSTSAAAPPHISHCLYYQLSHPNGICNQPHIGAHTYEQRYPLCLSNSDATVPFTAQDSRVPRPHISNRLRSPGFMHPSQHGES